MQIWNLVPKVLADRIEKKKKKRAMTRKIYDEVTHSRPKSVFSTVSGVWTEETASEEPLIAMASQHSCSTKFMVAPLMAKKKVTQVQSLPAAFDFRSKALFRESNVRENVNKKTAQSIFKLNK